MEYFNITGLWEYKNSLGQKYETGSTAATLYFDTRAKLQYLAEEMGRKLNISIKNNYSEKPNKQAGRGMGFSYKEYILNGFLPASLDYGKDIFIKLSFAGFQEELYFFIEVDINFSDGENQFHSSREQLRANTHWSIKVDEAFPKDWPELIQVVLPKFTNVLTYLHEFLNIREIHHEIENLIGVLSQKNQIILQGPPGTGKTYTAKDLAEQLVFGTVSADKKAQKEKLEASDQFALIQFHPSYSYEDFVRGITAKSVEGNIVYETENKILAAFAEKALKSGEAHVLIIDEINRANLPAVLGELIYALEYRDEAVASMYAVDGDRSITIPNNLYIIGTMNTADRSVGHIDYAIRRRFAFVDVLPNEEVINNEPAKVLFRQVAALFVSEEEGKLVNSDFLAADFDYKEVQLGHSYFILGEGSAEEQEKELQLRLQYEIRPILHEYVKDGVLLESAQKAINKLGNVGS